MKRSLKILGVATAIAVGVAAAPFELAMGDIVGSIVDDYVGVITNDAIRAVKALPSGSGTVGSTLDRRTPRPRWRALHDDDDSLLSVRVSAGDADWCVAYSLTARPIPHMKIRDIAPATRAAQIVSGSLGTLYSDLPTNSSWACSAIRTYFKKTSRDALFRHSADRSRAKASSLRFFDASPPPANAVSDEMARDLRLRPSDCVHVKARGR